MKKKDDRLLPASEFPDPDGLMPDPRRAKEKLKAESKEPKPEIKTEEDEERTEDIQQENISQEIKSTKADKYRR
ncbi:MAG: hypothetical protein JW901_05480 [Dehalococcoidia bacterium]|nr:hypothetical protein [Dehalococcoidia bacterium]